MTEDNIFVITIEGEMQEGEMKNFTNSMSSTIKIDFHVEDEDKATKMQDAENIYYNLIDVNTQYWSMTGIDYYMVHPRYSEKVKSIIKNLGYEPIKATMYLVDYHRLIIWAIAKKVRA
jgi:hypothetical protein